MVKWGCGGAEVRRCGGSGGREGESVCEGRGCEGVKDKGEGEGEGERGGRGRGRGGKRKGKGREADSNIFPTDK